MSTAAAVLKQYLTRQVATLDSTENGRVALADYCSAKGESPGRC